MAWPTSKATSWYEFVATMSQIQVDVPPGATYVFRGQPNADYSLAPSLQRHVAHLSRADAIQVEAILLADFQSQAHLLLRSSLLPDYRDVVSWWTLMQHHGSPTRLLDWTKSPYVAAYFAVESQPDKDGAVWLFHNNLLTVRMRELGAPSMEEVFKDLPRFFLAECELTSCYLFQRKQKIDRMVTQQGGFTIAPDVLADHAELVERALSAFDKEEWFRKIVIPAELKPEFLLQLHRLNVNGIALFPGIDGLGRSMREIAALQVHSRRHAPRAKGA